MKWNSRVVSAFVLSAVFHLQLLDVDGVAPSTENLQKSRIPGLPRRKLPLARLKRPKK